jgi:hypothetical protein
MKIVLIKFCFIFVLIYLPDITQAQSVNKIVVDHLSYVKSCACDLQDSLTINYEFIRAPDSVSRYGLFLLKQDLTIYQNGRRIIVNKPFFKHHYIVQRGRRVKVLSTNIIGVKCIKGTGKDFVYYLYGADNSDISHEFFGVLAKNGKWLWYSYGSADTIYAKFGNYQKVISKYGKDEFDNLKNLINTLPD